MIATGNKGTVGMVGLGIMGGAIASNLAAAGWRVIGFDIEAGRCRELSKLGVSIANGVGDLAAQVPVILTSLPHPSALETTARDIVASGVAKLIVVEMSTFALEDKQGVENVLRQGGHLMLDCPLSGTGAQAKVKDLVVYGSGDVDSFASLQPLFTDFSREAHHLGTFGNGTRMKFVANLLVAINNVATAEAFVLGMKAGLEPRKIYELVKSGAGNSRVFELRGPMMVEGRYDDPTMKIAVWQKDMAVIGDFAASLGCPTPLFNAAEPFYAAALSNGHGTHDTAAVCAVLETMAGVKRDSTK